MGRKCFPGKLATKGEQLVPLDSAVPLSNIFLGMQRNVVLGFEIIVTGTSYTLIVQVYTGKKEKAPLERNQGISIIFNLIRELELYKFACDNFFTSYILGLLVIKIKITMVGTVRTEKSQNFLKK